MINVLVMSKTQAAEEFRKLVRRYGIQWTTAPKPEDWQMLAEINKVLDAYDRRAALLGNL